jgi:hypothetical protein
MDREIFNTPEQGEKKKKTGNNIEENFRDSNRQKSKGCKKNRSKRWKRCIRDKQIFKAKCLNGEIQRGSIISNFIISKK